eukprot:SAG11_NODE_28397_length_322_cov_0.699552_1_plen_54_part_10
MPSHVRVCRIQEEVILDEDGTRPACTKIVKFRDLSITDFTAETIEERKKAHEEE